MRGRPALILWTVLNGVAGIFACLYCNEVPSWGQPSNVVTYNVSMNASLPLKVGQVVNLTCVAWGNVETATMEWMQVAGTNEARKRAGRSPLSLVWTVQAADHGVEFYCGSWFTASVAGDYKPDNYYSKSDTISIRVEGVTKGAFVVNSKERVRVAVKPVTPSYKEHDIVQYVCEVENMSYHPPVEIMQRKDNIEYKLYFGYQTGFRWMSQNLTTADDGTEVYCIAWRHDSRWNSYRVNSEPYKISIKN